MTDHALGASAPPRPLHPGAWWCWALGAAAAATATTNPLLLALILAVLGQVVAARRTAAPWARAFVVFLRIAAIVLVIRTVFQVLLSTRATGTVLITLPEVPLPTWMAGVALGGPVTAEALLASVSDGLRLATILVCVGAANALANPKRLLASLPAALHEVGVAVVVAVSFTPQLVEAVRRVRSARRLRGRPDRGVRAVVSVAVPVLEEALERSLALAAAMDSRGYGRRQPVSAAARRGTAALLLTGLLGVAVGAFGLLGSGPSAGGVAVWVVAGGLATAVAGLWLAGRRTVRTRYRPDPWALPEWLTAGAGVAMAVGMLVTAALEPAALQVPVDPLAVPALPAVATGAVLLGVLPGWLTPQPTTFGTGAARPEVAA